jgi:hypothetical protein
MVEQKMRGKGKAVGRGGTFSAGTTISVHLLYKGNGGIYIYIYILTIPFTQSILSFSF